MVFLTCVKLNLLGIDFEDWFHPELIQKNLKTREKKPQVINGIDKILNWLEKRNVSATFFTVGELLEYHPELLDKILDNGHEIGFHTMTHTRLDSQTPEEFELEVQTFEKLTSKKSKGFRAPTFSLNSDSSWILDILSKYGYLYDSSIVPAKTKLYGLPNAEKNPYRINSSNLEKNTSSSNFFEFPILTTGFFGKTMPVGGFYLRFLPMYLIEKEIRNRNNNNFPATIYIHSWELTPEFMPKIKLPLIDNFITFHNINHAFSKMDKLLETFSFTSFEKYMSNNFSN